jgi:hypothetical protein
MNTASPSDRPRTVTITLWGVFILGGWNLARAVVLSRQSSLLLALGVSLDPRLRLIIALCWAILFWGAAFALWRKRPFARQAIPIILLLYGLYQLSLLLFFTQTQTAQRRWLLNTLSYTVAVLFTLWALNRATVITYFKNGQSKQNKE